MAATLQTGTDDQENALATTLTDLVASLYHLYLVAHAGHWNVTGMSFVSLHTFFGQLYEDTFGSIDGFAEGLRQHGYLAPSAIDTSTTATTDATECLKAAEDANASVLTLLQETYDAAETAGDCGLSNYAQERLLAHRKWQWQLVALLE